MVVLDTVADVRKNTENYTGGKCIININNFRASVLYSNIFLSHLELISQWLLSEKFLTFHIN
jgi:hypothetical protein